MRPGFRTYRIPRSVAFCVAVICIMMPLRMAGWEYFEPAPAQCKGGTTAVLEFPSGCGEFVLEGKLLFSGNHMAGGLNGQQWIIEFLDDYSDVVRRITARYDTAPLYNGFADSRFLKLTLDSVSSGGESVNCDVAELHNDAEIYGRVNTVVIDNRGGTFAMWLGRDGGVYAIGGELPRSVAAIRIGGTKDMKLYDTVVKWRRDLKRQLATAWTIAELEAIDVAVEENPAGQWRFLDRDTDSRWAEPGGRYRLAIVPHDSLMVADAPQCDGRIPEYDVIYIGGATTNSRRWEPGMVKAHLYATPFAGHYDVVWFDALFEDMGEEVTADLTDGAVLSFRFPIYKSMLRFARN
ncbi:MAG: hypothetical protein HDS68_01575 [Bacteroidales bacterium]|nr:hypothetical protein [Bacteroidales bacterium]